MGVTMIRIFVVGLFLLASPAHAELKLSALQDKIVTVSAPTTSAKENTSFISLRWFPNGTWVYAPAGDWLIQNAMVDRENRIGPWSQPLVLNMPQGWILIASNSNIPNHKDRAAVAWRATRVSTGEVLLMCQGHRGIDSGAFGDVANPQDTLNPYPWSANLTSPYPLVFHTRGNAGIPLQNSTILAGAPPLGTPICWPATHQLKAGQVAWAWATHGGETALSPTSPIGGFASSAYGYRRLTIAEPIPMGAIGRYLYLKIDGKWRRQLAAPWWKASSLPDKYLFGVHDNQPILWEDHLGPEPVVDARSVVSPIQQSAFSNDNSITVDASAHVYGPMIEPYKPGLKKRTYSAPGFGGWTLTQRANAPGMPNTHPTYWPLFVAQNEEVQGTTLYSMFCQDDRSRGPGASMCLTCSDYSGGQGFKLRGIDCQFSLDPHPTVTKEGLHIGWECGSVPGGHIQSEWLFERCSFCSIRIEGNQSVNNRFHTTHMLGFPTGPIILDGGAAYFTGGLNIAASKQLFQIGWIATLSVDQLFVDKRGHCLLDYTSYKPRPKVSIKLGDTAGWDFVSRAPVTKEKHRLLLNDWVGMRVEGENCMVYHCSYNRLVVDTNGSDGIQALTNVVQPALTEFMQRVPSVALDK